MGESHYHEVKRNYARWAKLGGLIFLPYLRQTTWLGMRDQATIAAARIKP